jgi:membrane fusion protein, macrolide-specific efflux system
MRVWRRPVFIVNGVLGLLALGGGFWAYQSVASEPAAAATTGQQRLVAASQGEVSATVSATGSVQSASTASATFATSGTVTEIRVKVGDTVKKHQILAKIDPTDAQAQLDTAEANLTAARASLDRAKSATTVDDDAVANAESAVTSAQSNVDEAQRTVDGTALRAPMAGTVTTVNGTLGGSSGGSSGGNNSNASSSSSISSSSSGFIQLANLGKMQVAASFAEADATKLKQGQAATVTWSALSGTRVAGKVATIAPTASTSNNVNTYAVVLSLDSTPAGARIGQTVTAVVTVADVTDAIRVPTAAVRSAGGQRTVTVSTNGTTEARRVEVGVEGDSFTQITSGLTVGEQVVIETQATSTSNQFQFPGGNFPGGGLGGGGLGGGPAGGAGGAGGGGR